MKFTSPSLVSEAIWAMRWADRPRGTNRSYIDQLVNGNPPYTEQERDENNIEVNVNFLDATQLVADARRSYYNGFQSPGKFFSVSLDYGPPHSRIRWGNKITEALKTIMKGNRLYAECLDAQFASTTLHGIGPAVWVDDEHWVPEEKGIDEVLIPGDTLRSLRNLDHFAVFYQYTPEQLYRLTHGPKRDKAWNMPMVDAALKWAHTQTQSSLTYSQLFMPEKREERFKQDLGFYGTDTVPTVDFWKFFYHEDKAKESGWRMKMIIDVPAEWEVGFPRKGGRKKERPRMPDRNAVGESSGQWLYDPGDRVYADNIEKLIHFQFGDLSARAPFTYHSIRSLGWLLYSVCHLQNRLLCRYNEAVFESLMQYFRGNEADKTRVQKVDLLHYGFVPDGVNFVRPEERWQVNSELVEKAIDRNRERMEYSAAQYRQGRDMGAPEREKTATQVMAEVNSAMSMVGSMLTQATRYQQYQYREIARRFCKKNSTDPDVRKFRVMVLRAGVPEKALNSELWNIEPEKVMGGGNKTLQLAMADSLLQMRPMLDPESQRIVDRINIAAKTDNDDLAERLVPEVQTVSVARHDAAASFGTLMLGAPVPLRTGINHPDAIEALLADMAAVVARIEQTGGVATPQEIAGLQNVAQHIQQHLQILGQNPAEKQRVRQYGQELGQLMNLVKAYSQRLAEMQKQQAQQGNGGGFEAKDMAKAKVTEMMGKIKMQNMEQSHAQRTAQRQVQFERQMQQDAQKHALEMRKKMVETHANVAATDLVTASQIRQNKMKSLEGE